MTWGNKSGKILEGEKWEAGMHEMLCVSEACKDRIK